MEPEFIEAVVKYLEGQAVGTKGIDLFAGGLPPKPTDAVAVMGSGGVASGGDPIRRPSFQVVVRGEDRQMVLGKGRDVYEALKNAWNVLEGYRGRIEATNEPGAIGLDSAENYQQFLNFKTSITP